jgi:hypothetical protein
MIDQIEAVDIKLDAVIYLDLRKSNEGAKRLLDRGRPDDNIETIGARVATYWRYTFPLVKYFTDKGLLIRINASNSIGKVLAQTVVQLSKVGIIEVTDYIHKLVKEYHNDVNRTRKANKKNNNRDKKRKRTRSQ